MANGPETANGPEKGKGPEAEVESLKQELEQHKAQISLLSKQNNYLHDLVKTLSQQVEENSKDIATLRSTATSGARDFTQLVAKQASVDDVAQQFKQQILQLVEQIKELGRLQLAAVPRTYAAATAPVANAHVLDAARTARRTTNADTSHASSEWHNLRLAPAQGSTIAVPGTVPEATAFAYDALRALQWEDEDMIDDIVRVRVQRNRSSQPVAIVLSMTQQDAKSTLHNMFKTLKSEYQGPRLPQGWCMRTQHKADEFQRMKALWQAHRERLELNRGRLVWGPGYHYVSIRGEQGPPMTLSEVPAAPASGRTDGELGN